MYGRFVNSTSVRRSIRRSFRNAATLCGGATLVSSAHQTICFADVQGVPVALVPVVTKKRMIAKSVYVEEEKNIRADLMEWMQKVGGKLLEEFAEITGTCKKLVKYVHRFLTIAIVSSPMAVLAPLTYFLGNNFPTLQDLTMQYGVWAMEVLGPAFIKMGQWASTRPDLYPPHVVSRLAALQDDVKVNYPMETVEATLTDALGEGWKEILTLDPNPIGAGCIAQVFKGTLNSEMVRGEQVAVKVIHPHVKETLRTDMELLVFFAGLLDCIPSLELLSIGEACRGFCKSMNDQLDMRQEAYNLAHFSKKFANESWALFPTPFQDLTTANVLVETLMEGTSISKFMDLTDEMNGIVDEEVRKLKLKLSDICGKTMIKMIFFDNFIHGDLHPGNILVNFSDKGEPRLVILDTGIVYTAKDADDHSRIVDICMAFMQHDGRKAARLMLDEKAANEQTKALAREGKAIAVEASGAEGFIEGVQGLVDAAEDDSYFEHIGEYVTKMCDLARVHGVKLNPGYFHIAMALKVTEGISLALDRNLDLVSTILPVILKAKALEKIGAHSVVFGDLDMNQVARDYKEEARKAR